MLKGAGIKLYLIKQDKEFWSIFGLKFGFDLNDFN